MADYKLPIITGTSLTVGDLLRWNGSAWVNYPDSNYAGESYIDRGDPAANDRLIGDLTNDGAWYDLDLGPNGLAIVPAGASLILLKVFLDGDVGDYAQFRENGNSNAFNIGRIKVLSATGNTTSILVGCDSNGVIEYLLGNSPTYISIVVRGWWT